MGPFKPAFFSFLWGTAVALTAGCSDSLPDRLAQSRQRPAAAGPPFRDAEVRPQMTDREIDNWLEPHYVAVGRPGSDRPPLFLFFSGSYGEPSRQQAIVQQAARLGIPAINLRYPNSWSVASLCGGSRDRHCHEKVRLEILDGVDRTEAVEVSRSNSIENRLVQLLRYLHRRHPEEGWLEYLDGNLPQWQSIIVAGHSQGGGQAAMIAKQHSVARAVLLAAPADYSRRFGDLAPWLAEPGATPPERYYGFVHRRDPAAQKIQRAWEWLGMAAFGPAVSVDRQPPPYQHSHQLTTGAAPARAGKYHGSVATDRATPKLAGGRPQFEGVWTYLMTGHENPHSPEP